MARGLVVVAALVACAPPPVPGQESKAKTVKTTFAVPVKRPLLYKLVASPKAYPAAEKEFVKARGTLKALK